MGLKTKINYVDSTHNFWIGGCEPISEGCKNCFAEKMYKRFWGKDFSIPIKSKNFDAPLKWKKPRVILVNDMSDFFHKDIPIEWRLQALHLIDICKQHIFLLLTKRPNNMLKHFEKLDIEKFGNHIWLGVSVENQKAADERIPELLKIPHFKKWVSVEPLLGKIDVNFKGINWVVCGGETGTGALPIWYGHFFGIKYDCELLEIPFFIKQMCRKEPIPKYLMVREYPPEIKAIRGKQ
jgi:protein gp37